MKNLIISLLLSLMVGTAFASEFYCSGTPKTQVSQTNDSWETSAAIGSVKGAKRGKHKLERFDILQAYSGQPVLLGSTWLTACMLPVNHHDTHSAFLSLIGVSPQASAAMSSSTGLIDRGIRITRDMRQCLIDNAPAVGYSSMHIEGGGIKLCF